MPHQCTDCGRTFADGSKQMLAGCPDCGGNKFQFRPKGSIPASENQPAESGSSRPTQPKRPQQPTNSDTGGKTRTTTLREWAKKKVTPGNSTADTLAASSNAGSPSSNRTSPATRSRGQSASTETGSTATDLDSFGDDSSKPGQPGEGTDDTGTIEDPRQTRDAETVEDSDYEDSAQADARRGLITENELPDRPTSDDSVRDRSATRQSVESRRQDEPHEQGEPDQEGELSQQTEPGQQDEQEPRPDLAQLRQELNDQFESIKVVEPGQYELNLMELYDRDEYIIALQENGRYVIEVPDAWDATE